MQINPLLNLNLYNTQTKQEISDTRQPATAQPQTTKIGLHSKFNDHLLSFKSRVDKGLDRFYEANKNRMPFTVKRYVDSLEDKSRLTPLEAQQRAFYKLKDAQSVEDIKKDFPDEELFSDLKNPEDSAAKRGILNSVKENQELIELYDKGVLKDKKNLTVYLVQKVFLEAKTIDEINKDLENDLDEDFKSDFKFKNKDSKYVYGSTLKSLGIKPPSFEYQQSLRYTRKGYSDEIGEKISQGQRAFWDSLSEEDRTARAKKSVQQFEIWWNSFSTNQKLDMIAAQMSTLDMLKDFKKSQKAEKNTSKTPESKEDTVVERKHVKTGSSKLSKDELFIKWATNNLKIFEANLSEAEKDTLHLKRLQRLVARWAQMTPAEKTDYISKLKSGTEPLRYAMIDAWNHSTDLIKDLSIYLKENQIFKPADLLYSTQEFSEHQSRVMNAFWDKHPDYAIILGNKIRESHLKIRSAIQRGTFEELKKQIMRDKNQRVKELEKFKNQNIKPLQIPDNNTTLQYVNDFKQAYLKAMAPRLHFIPDSYMKEYFESIKDLPKEYVISWTKNLKGEMLSTQDEENLTKLMQSNCELTAFEANRALEAALSSVLYQYTANPEVFRLSFSDVKTAIYKLEIGENPVTFFSTRLKENFILPVKEKPHLNKKKIEDTYNSLRQPISNEDVNDILHNYFYIDEKMPKTPEILEQFNKQNELLKDYIKKHNRSILMIFSDKSVLPPQVKDRFYQKFIANMQKDMLDGPIKPLITSLEDFKYEEKIKKACYLFGRKFDFVPSSYMKKYSNELSKQLRLNKQEMPVEIFSDVVCAKRKTPKDHGKVMMLSKYNMTMENKLYSLAIEQALADILYEATENKDVYKLGFETLADTLETLLLVKKFPAQEALHRETPDHVSVDLRALRRPNTGKINRLYNEYLGEIIDWTKEISQKGTEPDLEDLLYILNPDENNPEKDIATAQRMAMYGLAPEKITIYPNNNILTDD